MEIENVKWITNGKDTPFYARKKINVSSEIEFAEAKVCGLGQFNFYINGLKVDDHILDPPWTNYNKQIQYVSFDATKYLSSGENVIGFEVGNGWFIKCDYNYTFNFPDFMPPNPNPYKAFGESLILFVILRIKYKNGEKEQIISDESFKVKEHMVCKSNVFGSELIDARRQQKGWNTVEFDDSEWDYAMEKKDVFNAQLKEQTMPPIKIIKTYKSFYLNSVNGKEIYDFRQNMSGLVELWVKGKKGDKIDIYPAEKLDINGDVDQMAKNWIMINNCITYIIGEDDTWEHCTSHFTYFAGRYIGIYKSEESIELKDLKAHSISSAYKKNGEFSCDDERYEKIYDLVEKAVEANMLSVHTDCPTIERFAWQEPNHLMAPSIMFMKDVRGHWDKFLEDMRIDQHCADDYFFDFDKNKFYPGAGLMPAQAPCYIPNVLPVRNMGSFYDIIPWGSTCILGTYWHYQFYGDVKIIQDNYDSGMKYLDYLKTKINSDGFIAHGLGDWGNPKNEYARENIETAFLYADAITLKNFANILGKFEDEAELGSFAENVKTKYNEKLLVKHPEQDFYCYRVFENKDEISVTQATQALPLYWGLVPDEKEKDVVKALKYTMEKEKAFICGEIGLPYVIQMAKKYGMNNLISEFILRPSHPSYYAFVLDNETTLGEYWENNPRSHCHDMMGHIVEWYYNGIAGIEILEAGFKKIKIKPYLPKTINKVHCTYKSICGIIEIDIMMHKKHVEINIKIPKNIKYEIDLYNIELRNIKIELIINNIKS